MGAATVTSKGQVTIPADVRQAFDIRAGDKITFFTRLTGELRLRVGRPRHGAGRGTIAAHGADLSRDAIGEAVADGVAERVARIEGSADRER